MGEMLKGRRAIVTGGFGALGSAVTRSLLAQGASVYATHRPKSQPDLSEPGLIPLPCDVTDHNSVAEAFRAAAADGVKPAILIHSAGGFSSDGNAIRTSLETWNTMLRLNLTSSFIVAREALRMLDAADYGRLIFISAYSALAPGPGAVAYKVAKAGLGTMVEVLHAERQNVGITVNALAPKIIDTPQNRKDMPDADHASWVSTEALAQVIVFLCSESGGAISGSVIPLP